MELSPFQKLAIQAIREGHHVLVTAHTGSGKTLPAEFAITHFAEQGKKIIYTSPIKALSNQKYADFSRKFPHISFGLLTGDIKTNPDAQVLIMTTEILMNALFKPPSAAAASDLAFSIDIHHDLACVVFDEIHYINDADRGHVWEKTILMLPHHIQMVMLSATIDNPARFARWIETTKEKKVVLASTLTRVVPLTHYSFVAVSESALKKVDKATEKMIRENTKDLTPLLTADGVFQERGYHKIHKVLPFTQAPRKFALNQLLLQLRNQEMLPAICFVFSRKQVEYCAQEITVPLLEDDSKVGYTVARECEQVLRKLPNFDEYMQTDDYRLVTKLLEKGIGIHHSGMIPILRELVELMIAKKHIKVLFATESFAIGLDCPIKTAVFTSLTKFDGQRERLLHAHEYTQMAGRAGRRGIDTVGHVVHLNNLFFPSASEYRDLLSGKPQRLVSKFTVSYHLVLSLLTNATRLTLDECCVFANLSLRRQDSDAAKECAAATLAAKQGECDTLLASIQCPLETCQSYLALERTLATTVNRKRKIVERDMRAIVDEHRTCLVDVKRVAAWNALQTEMRDLSAMLSEDEMRQQMHSICDVMVKTGFIDKENEKYFLYSPTGTMAAGLAEVHPLIMTDLLLRWAWFRDLDVEQIAAVLSCFAEVKVADVPPPRRDADAEVEACAQDVRLTMGRYAALDGSAYEGHYSLLAWIMRWTCECRDVADCRAFLRDLRATLGVSAGDFAKAMLKISTIGKEIAAIAETHCQLECCQKLAQLDATVLKYVATSQSLYV